MNLIRQSNQINLINHSINQSINLINPINQSNESIRLEPSGTGTVEIYSDWNITGDLHSTGNITFSGDLTLGDDDSDTVTFTSDVNSSLMPDVNDVSNLGTLTKRWNNLHVTDLQSASLDTGSLKIDTNVIQSYANNDNLDLYHSVHGKKVDIDAVL